MKKATIFYLTTMVLFINAIQLGSQNFVDKEFTIESIVFDNERKIKVF